MILHTLWSAETTVESKLSDLFFICTKSLDGGDRNGIIA